METHAIFDLLVAVASFIMTLHYIEVAVKHLL